MCNLPGSRIFRDRVTLNTEIAATIDYRGLERGEDMALHQRVGAW